MEVALSTQLDADPDRVWEELQKPALMAYVARGMVRFRPIDPARFPEYWTPGDYLVALSCCGVPIGRQRLRIEMPPEVSGVRRLRDNGRGSLARVWDHTITVAPAGTGTRYTDHVRIEAGWLTLPVAVFARLFYGHRQRRWRRLVRNGFDHAR